MDREQIEAEVRARRQTPVWAEQQVEARGEGPFAPIQQPWSYWEGAGKWPITLAVLWLSCASPEQAAGHWNRLRSGVAMSGVMSRTGISHNMISGKR